MIRGGASGLRSSGSQRWTQASAGIAGKPATYDFFGWSLAAADFGRADRGAGLDDLAIGVSGERVGKVPDAGSVQVIYGSSKGLRAKGSVVINRASSGVLGTARREAQVGRALTVGDFGRTTGGRPLADLAMAGRDEGVNILFGARAGLSTGDDQFLTDLGFVLPSN